MRLGSVIQLYPLRHLRSAIQLPPFSIQAVYIIGEKESC